jgi:branched-chain amino acid transport system substrate-binding protein
MLDAIERASENGEVSSAGGLAGDLRHRDYEGVLGTWSFDEDGDTTLTELSVQTVEGGEFTLDRVLDVEELV